MPNKNQHVEYFLDHYCTLKRPEYAVLIKGKWGTGKTHFIKQYLDKNQQNTTNGKITKNYLYVSLYGIKSPNDIENIFFQQLHPFLSSKGMSLAGNVVKGLVNTTFKFDMNGDGKDDGTVRSSIPDTDIRSFLTNIEKYILVFDDLERCSMNIRDSLGYINYFVEYQGYRAIIIANENIILEKEEDASYKEIKEKLIGETFEIESDVDNALGFFIAQIKNTEVMDLYNDNKDVIKELYFCSKKDNLRILNRSLLGYEWFFTCLPNEAKEKRDILIHFLKLYVIYSLEIRSGDLDASDINHLTSYSVISTKDDKPKIREISNKYSNEPLEDTLFSSSLWKDIFDKNYINTEGIKEFFIKHHSSVKQDSWVYLWHFNNLTDEEFEQYFSKIKTEYENKKIKEIGVLKHVIGLFLEISDIGLYEKTKDEILFQAKSYVNSLKESEELSVENAESEFGYEAWGGKQFHGKDLPEFKDFCTYLDNNIEDARIANLPHKAKELLDLMTTDTVKFLRMLIVCNDGNSQYYNTPILKHINKNDFITSFIALSPQDQNTVCCVFDERYKNHEFNEKLQDELDWLYSIKSLFTTYNKTLTGKLSHHRIRQFIKNRLQPAIASLSQQSTQPIN